MPSAGPADFSRDRTLEESYRAVAEKRLGRVRRLERGALEVATSKRAEPRVPFGQLVERGMLRPGEMLVNARGQMAKVRVDGTLIADDVKGSIHQVGAKLEGAPSCNGWTYWHFRRDGQTVPIDVLRQQLRAEMERIGFQELNPRPGPARPDPTPCPRRLGARTGGGFLCGWPCVSPAFSDPTGGLWPPDPPARGGCLPPFDPPESCRAKE